jgi:tRNA A37 N6-isopentenylltransferase MiaA
MRCYLRRVTFIRCESRAIGREIIAEEVAKVHCAFIHTSLSREARRRAERIHVITSRRLRRARNIMEFCLFGIRFSAKCLFGRLRNAKLYTTMIALNLEINFRLASFSTFAHVVL